MQILFEHQDLYNVTYFDEDYKLTFGIVAAIDMINALSVAIKYAEDWGFVGVHSIEYARIHHFAQEDVRKEI